jgi:hypothetical protein
VERVGLPLMEQRYDRLQPKRAVLGMAPARFGYLIAVDPLPLFPILRLPMRAVTVDIW